MKFFGPSFMSLIKKLFMNLFSLRLDFFPREKAAFESEASGGYESDVY